MEIKNFIQKYNAGFAELVSSIEVTKAGNIGCTFEEAVATAVALIKEVQQNRKKIIFVGNGGSASIASHQAVDYWKNGGIRAIAFNDSSLLTCISNDYSYAEVFSKPIEQFADAGDVIFCISSSGKSANILAAADMGKTMNCNILTFSGFQPDNPLRSKGILNFYLPALSYGFAEIMHLFIIHCILDAKMYCEDGIDIFNQNSVREL